MIPLIYKGDSLLKVYIRSLVFLSMILVSHPAFAKNLTGRIGLGYNGQFSSSSQTNGVPAISVKIGVAPGGMIELIGGFYSGANGTGVAAFKYMSTLHAEEYANFYLLVGGGLVSAAGRSGTEFMGGVGTEFFIPGVDSVGISFEAGVSAENLTAGSYILKTFGASFLKAGMHFYF